MRNPKNPDDPDDCYWSPYWGLVPPPPHMGGPLAPDDARTLELARAALARMNWVERLASDLARLSEEGTSHYAAW
jgi:hypothetical protein